MDYYDHLGTSGPADGLEVLLTSLAINMHINLVFEDSIWATGKEGVDFKFLTVVCTTSGFLPCKVYQADSGELADVDTTKTSDSVDLDLGSIPASLKEQAQGGQPLMDIQLVSKSIDSSSMEIDPDQELIQVVHPVKPKVKHSGKSSPQLCMFCRVGLQSQTALNFHLKQCHLDQRPYHCIECMNSFVNRVDLQSHTSNIHTEKKIKCKHCEHRTVMKAKM